jgi:hypothetical protein
VSERSTIVSCAPSLIHVGRLCVAAQQRLLVFRLRRRVVLIIRCRPRSWCLPCALVSLYSYLHTHFFHRRHLRRQGASWRHEEASFEIARQQRRPATPAMVAFALVIGSLVIVIVSVSEATTNGVEVDTQNRLPLKIERELFFFRVRFCTPVVGSNDDDGWRG